MSAAVLIELIGQKIRELTPVINVWAVCKSVDWDNKTMVATGQIDDLDYEGVILGNGSEFKKPAVGSICLLGIIQNNAAMPFLIDAVEIEEYLIIDKKGFKYNLKDGKLTLNGDNFGGIVNAKELKIQVDKNTEAIKVLQQIFQSWTPSPNDGGAALKALVSSFNSKPTADLTNIENETIKHGNNV